MGHRLRRAPFTQSAGSVVCLQSATIIDESRGTDLCMHICIFAWMCPWVNTYVSDFSFEESLIMHANKLCVCMFVCMCVCLSCTLISEDIVSTGFQSSSFFIIWPSESCGCSSYPELVASLSQSLPVMEHKKSKAILIGNGISMRKKRSGLQTEMWSHMGIPSFVFNG